MAVYDEAIDFDRVPAFVMLFHLGKKTMRPGGMELTHQMLDRLGIGHDDKVIELAPGPGATTRLVLKHSPESYIAVERDETSKQKVEKVLENYGSGQCIVGTAQETGLEEGCASVVFGEAMLTMQTVAAKQQIVKEAYRLLGPGGRYSVHETCLIPEDLPEKLKKEIELALTKALRVGARPLTIPEWRELLEESGFSVRHTIEAPMLLLNPLRIIQDDGLLGTM